MIVIRNLNVEKKVALETKVLKHWLSDCTFRALQTGEYDVYIGAEVPIMINYFGGDDDCDIFFKCGNECVSVTRYDYYYISIE